MPWKPAQSVPMQSTVTDASMFALGHVLERKRSTMLFWRSDCRPDQSIAHVPVSIKLAKVHDEGRFYIIART